MARVRLEGIAKRFQDVEVLKPIDLDVADGELLVLLGPSGCGKSTALRIIAGLEEPTAGRLWIGDKDMTHEPPKVRDVAMVFQSYALYPHLTVQQNLAFGLKVRGAPKDLIESRVKEAAEMLHLTPLLERKPKQLSGGQRQRVAMGRAIVRRPQLFLFDEPLSNLDAALRTQMRAEIAGLHQRLGITTVYVTHDQVEAMTLASRIVILSSGVVQQIGPPLSVYDKPQNGFVARFLGSPAMNLLPGELVAGPRFMAPGLDLPLPGAAAGLVGKKLVLGLRPQALRLSSDGPIQGSVTLVEPTGGESYVRAKLQGDVEIVARAEGTVSLGLGAPVRFDLDARQAHFFARGPNDEPLEALG